jgi:uncharacterized membrane protein YqgA involved in biofilm formation
MIGTIVNTACIIAGSLLGATLKRGIKPQYQTALYNAMGLCAFVLGVNACVQNLPKSDYPVLFVVSLAVGSLVGYMLRLSERFSFLVEKLGKKSGNIKEKSSLAEGLSTGILLYCVGTLSMLGPVMSALNGDNTYLFTNATLDFVTSAVLASTYGFGMIWAAPVLFLWQGMFYLIAIFSSDFIGQSLMTELSIVGGVLIAASGMSILGIKDCKAVNMMPSLLIPVIYFIIIALW